MSGSNPDLRTVISGAVEDFNNRKSYVGNPLSEGEQSALVAFLLLSIQNHNREALNWLGEIEEPDPGEDTDTETELAWAYRIIKFLVGSVGTEVAVSQEQLMEVRDQFLKIDHDGLGNIKLKLTDTHPEDGSQVPEDQPSHEPERTRGSSARA